VNAVTATPTAVRLFEHTTVAASVTTTDTSLDGVLVVFSDGDPQQGGETFDAELIPHIRADDTYVTTVKFQPRTCGPHTVVVVAGPGTPFAATGTATVDVTLDAVAAVDELITVTANLGVPPRIERSLIAKLTTAKQAFAHHSARQGVHGLRAFIAEVEVQRGTTLTDEQAAALVGEAELIIGCI
jgi:hypothetical protein